MIERYKPKKQKQPIKAIREMCIECMGGGKPYDLIAECSTNVCALWEFRFGINPYKKKRSEAQVLTAKKNLLKMKQPPKPSGLVEKGWIDPN